MPLTPDLTIKIPIAERLQEMIGGDGVTPRQISDGSGDLQDAVIGPRAEVEVAHGVLQEFIPLIGEAALLL